MQAGFDTSLKTDQKINATNSISALEAQVARLEAKLALKKAQFAAAFTAQPLSLAYAI